MARPLRIESGPRPGAGRADALPRAAPAAIERGTVGRKFQRAGGEAGFGLVALRTDDRDAALAGRTVADGLLNAGEPGREVGGIQPGTRSAGNEEATGGLCVMNVLTELNCRLSYRPFQAETREMVRIRKRGNLERECAIPLTDLGACPGGASNCSGWIPNSGTPSGSITGVDPFWERFLFV